MQPIAAGLDAPQMREVVDWYAQLPAETPRPAQADAAAAIERGRAIAKRGVPERRIPSCVDCHGPEPRRTRENYPLLAGQWAEYLVLQLELFADGHRGGSRYAHLMEPVVRRLTREEMRDVAAFYAVTSRDGPPAR